MDGFGRNRTSNKNYAQVGIWPKETSPMYEIVLHAVMSHRVFLYKGGIDSRLGR